MEIISNKWSILYLITIIMLIVYVIYTIKQQKRIKKLENQVKLFNEQNTKLLQEQVFYNSNMVFLKKFISFYFILIDILTSKLGAKAEGFTYRTFIYKKENGVTIEKKQGVKKVTVKGEVGYIIKDKYFIKKTDLDTILMTVKQHFVEEQVIQKNKQKEEPFNYFSILKNHPELLYIKVEDVRGDSSYLINDND